MVRNIVMDNTTLFDRVINVYSSDTTQLVAVWQTEYKICLDRSSKKWVRCDFSIMASCTKRMCDATWFLAIPTGFNQIP